MVIWGIVCCCIGFVVIGVLVGVVWREFVLLVMVLFWFWEILIVKGRVFLEFVLEWWFLRFLESVLLIFLMLDGVVLWFISFLDLDLDCLWVCMLVMVLILLVVIVIVDFVRFGVFGVFGLFFFVLIRYYFRLLDRLKGLLLLFLDGFVFVDNFFFWFLGWCCSDLERFMMWFWICEILVMIYLWLFSLCDFCLWRK